MDYMSLNEFNPRLAKLSLINEQLVNLIPDSFESKGMLVNWLNSNPYSPYVTLYGGIGAKNFDSKSSFISPTDNKERFLLEDKISFKLENFISFDDKILSANTKLSNVINSSELFKNYPTFKDIEININISNSNKNYYTGSTFHNDNEANRINVYADSNENAMRVLLHELQHCIQLKEGFKIGASYYNEDGVMELFVGSNVDTDGNYKDGSFSDISTKATMFEIGDGEARIDLASQKRALENFNRPIERKLEELYSQLEKNEITKEDYDEIENKYLYELKTNPMNGLWNLNDILKHESLYEKYPLLLDIKVNFDESLGKGKANFNYSNDTISIGTTNQIEDLKSLLLHEIQHTIQKQESWAMGGNSKSFKDIDLAEEKKNALLKEIRSYIDFNFNSLDDNYRNAIRMINSGNDIEKGREIIQSNPTFKAEYANYILAYRDLEEIQSKTFEVDILSRDRQYLSLWGEQQARSVQYRMNMSEEERLKESWTKTLEKVEGRYDEPIIRYDSEIMNAEILEKKYLDKYGNVNYDVMIEEGLDKIPRYFTSFEKFETMFKNKVNKHFAVLKTPVGDVKINVRGAFDHLTKNTNNQDRTKWGGALIPIFENPLFVVKTKYNDDMRTVFYKPMLSKNKKQGILDLAGFAVDKKGNLVNTTFFTLKENKLIEMICSKEEDLLYYKYASATEEVVAPFKETSRTHIYDDIVSNKENNVKKKNTFISKEDREKNFKEWFGDSKVVDANGEPLVVYHGTGASFDVFDKNKIGSIFNEDENGFFFTNMRGDYGASGYAKVAHNRNNQGNVMPVYVSLKNPLTLDIVGKWYEYSSGQAMLDDYGVSLIDFIDKKKELVKYAIEDGYDGILFEDLNSEARLDVLEEERNKRRNSGEFPKFKNFCSERLVVAFESSQIKSIHNKGTFDIDNPNILEKNDYGLRQIEMMLSIVPDKMEMSKVKDYLLFNGVTHEHLRGSMYQTILDGDRFDISKMNLEDKVIDMNNTYFNSFGEIESRKIEDIYINKIDSIDINELFNDNHSTQDISEAMGEIEKSERKIEQRLG
jgi:hypothetical protein